MLQIYKMIWSGLGIVEFKLILVDIGREFCFDAIREPNQKQ